MKINNSVKKVLELTALGVVFVLAASQSHKPVYKLIGYGGKLTAIQIYRLKKKIDKMVAAKLLHLSGDKVVLSHSGKLILTGMELEDIKINHHEWDKVWRVISWDIPMEKQDSATIYRKLLRNWGFTKAHQSLWVFPWECKKELAIIAKRLDISDHIIYLKIEHLPAKIETRLIKSYSLKSIKS